MNKIAFNFLILIMLLVTAATLRTEFPATLQQQLSVYYRYYAPAKLFVDLNQPKYSAGDTAFFKIYVLSATGKPQTTGKHVVNVMLVNTKQQSILHNKTLIHDGKGFSQLIIPSTIPEGSYTLLASIDDDAAGKIPPAYFQRPFVITGEKLLVSEKVTPSVQFFAEGGNLVEGLANVVMVSGLNGAGEAHVTDNSGNRVASFQVSPNGLGRFSFTPRENRQYTVEYKGTWFPVDAAEQDGVAMTVTGNQSGEMEASLQVKNDSPLRETELYLIMNMHDQICSVIPVSFKKNTTLSLTLSNKLCAGGVAQLTLFSASGEALAERIVFLAPQKFQVEILPGKAEYHTREKAEVLVRVASTEQAMHTGNASITVYKKDFFNDITPVSFTSHVLFNSDLSLPPGISLDDHHTAEEINDVLIACRWKKFAWNNVLGLKPGAPASASPIFFKGRVTDSENKPVKDSTMITFWLNQNDFIYGVYTRNNGEFYFPLFKNFTDDNALYAVTHKGMLLKNARVTMATPPAIVENAIIHANSSENDAYHAFTKVKIPVMRSFSYYERKYRDSLAVQIDSEETPDYIETDFTIDLRKYKNFSSVAEMLGEVIPMVKSKKAQGKDDIRVFIKGNSMFASASPLLVIDGVLTDSIGYLMAMDPSTILSMGVIHDKNELVRYGVLGKNGILVITTSAPGLHQEALRGKGTLNVKGIDTPLAFKAKQHRGQLNNRIPDLRSTLYWQPDVKLFSTKDTLIEFYTADGTGTYVIKVTGMTQAGIPFEVYRDFNVTR